MIRPSALDAAVRVIETPEARPSPSRDTLARVDALWREQLAERGSALFDGKLFSVTASSPNEIRGWFADYRWWVAQRCEPELRGALGVRPLGVTGLLRAGDATLFGLRTARVLANPGVWELAPSGGVEPAARCAQGKVSLVAQLLAEAREELGVGESSVVHAAPFALIEDERSGVFDAFVEVTLALAQHERERVLERAGGPDYAQLEWVPNAARSAWVAARRDSLDPASAAALEIAGLLAH